MPPALEVFDAVLVGAGQAANPLSRSLAKAGWRVALAENGPIGGSCVNYGCTPTKTMAACARVAYLARRARDFGVQAGEVVVHMDEVRRRKQAVVDHFRDASERALVETDGVTLLRGPAAFVGPREVEVRLPGGDARRVTAPKVVINVGCRPATPDIDGIGSVPSLDSTSVMELTEVPEHLVILGGGYIGLEFGQMFRRFGSRVTVVVRGKQILPREDDDVAAALTEVLREDGVEVLLNTKAKRASAPSAGAVELEVEAAGGTRTLPGSHLLVATGRTPNTEALNLAAADVKTDDKGYIPVNERLETSAAGVYALGDVTGGPAFTHVSHNDNQILRENLLHNAGRTTKGRLLPYTVFTDPQLGRVGLSEREAREQGYTVRVAKLPMSKVARAFENNEDRGVMKAVVDAKTDKLLGAAVLGVEGGEIMAVLQVAMMGGLKYQRLRDDMFAHPTLARGMNALFAKFEGE